MRNTEINIGDIILVGYGVMPIKVTQVSQIYVWGTTANGNDVQDTIKSASPIALSKEIFELNGWKCDGYFTYSIDAYSHLEYYWQERRLRRVWQGVDEWQNHSRVREIPFECNVRSVHELQHALRQNGLDKMADNFKIKEKDD